MRTSKLAIGIVAALGLCLALGAGPASAKQVYDYVYSGEYIDGTGSEAGAFPQGLAGVAYDEEREDLLAAVGASPGRVSRFTKAGVGDPFALPTIGDTLTLPNALGSESLVAVDDSGGPNAGNVYVAGIGSFPGTATIYGFKPDGTPLPGFERFKEGICGIDVSPAGDIWITARLGLERLDTTGETIQSIRFPESTNYCNAVVDSGGDFYVVKRLGFTESPARKLDSSGGLLYRLGQGTAVHGFAVDPSTDDVFALEGADTVSYYDSVGAKLGSFGAADPGHSFAGLAGAPRGLAVDPQTHDVWVSNRRDYGGGVRHLERFVRSAPITVPTTVTGAAVDYAGTSAVLHGTLDPDGVETTDCHFEWGTTEALGSSMPCAEGNEFSGSGSLPVSAQLEGLKRGSTYFFRVSAHNGNERVSTGGVQKFIAQDRPVLGLVTASEINTDGAQLNVEIDPDGGNTTYYFEYGVDEGYGASTPVSAPFGLTETKTFANVVTGLQPNTTYHYRVVAENEAGVTVGEDLQFRTFKPDSGSDSCPNAAVRKQTRAALLLDCRAYELVSARNAGGYDVESLLVPGQQPLFSSPLAPERLLYAVHSGAVPGVAGNPTNFDRDPYLATRRPDGRWSTSYVGLPANGMTQEGAFGSPLLEADAALDRFAFGGAGICSPCFADGSTNIPLRLADGTLTRGMAGSLEPGSAEDGGNVAKRLSADGSHLIFSSLAKFEPAGKNGFLTIYDRNLETGLTQVVSTLPNGQTMGAGDAYELDVSTDGSRILLAQKLAPDAKGNDRWHLYLHIGTEAKSLDLTPGTTSGVLYDGMSSDGSKIFFTTADKLLPAQDTDLSADVYEAAVDPSGAMSLSLVSVGQSGPSNDDSCEPAGIPDSWNSVQGDGRCNAVTPAAGAGVGADGTLYFFSPELLDGPANGVADQANLYVVQPGAKPRFVTTVDSAIGKPGPEEGLGLVNTFGSVSKSFPVFVAVDNSEGPSDGDIYVADSETGLIRKYDQNRNPIASWASAGVLDGSAKKIQELVIVASSGFWRLSFDGESTKELSSGVNAAQLQVALEELPNIDPGDVVVQGGSAGNQGDQTPMFATFGGQYQEPNVPPLIAENISLNPGANMHVVYQEPFGGVKFGGSAIKGITVDGAGNLDVAAEPFLEAGSRPRFYRFTEGGAPIETSRISPSIAPSSGLAVDPTGGKFFFARNGFGNGEVAREGTGTAGNVTRTDSKSPVGGFAVDSSTGDLFVGRASGALERYSFDAAGKVIQPGGKTCEPAYNGGGCAPIEEIADLGATITGMAVDPTNHHLFVDLGGEAIELTSAGEPVGHPFGKGVLLGSTSIAVNFQSGNVLASDKGGGAKGTIREFGIVPVSWTPIDDPAIVHGVGDAGTHRYSDFQVTPDGRYAAFGSSEPLKPGFRNFGYEEIYRYDASAEALDCVSCAPSGAAPSTDTSLSHGGLNLADDGRLFFTSAEPYVLRDANLRSDVYEWSGGTVQLISTGKGAEDSALLTVSADGTDAFFFTRETLAADDENGSTVKVYDAREGGGFLYEPPSPVCKASDECHGAGTQSPPAPAINTVSGSGRAAHLARPSKECKKKRFVKRRGKCERRSHPRKDRQRRHHSKRRNG